MDKQALMALSPLDGRYQAKMASLRLLASEYGLIQARFEVEIRWLIFLAEQANLPNLPVLTADNKAFLLALVAEFSTPQAARVKEIEASIKHDVKAVEYALQEILQAQEGLKPYLEFIHFGCTSEDINNLAYGLMLVKIRETCLLPTLTTLLQQLQTLAHTYAALPMLARTHGQAASPTTVGKELANIAARLKRQLEQLRQTPILGKINGATGNYNALAVAYPEIPWPKLNQTFIAELGLAWNPYTTQIEPHDALAELFAIILRINIILIDFNRDMWGYIALNYFSQKQVAAEVGSSTMPHKINPIDFENAEGNLGIANALLEHMMTKLPISRWQRDLSDSTVLRNIGVALGHSLLAYEASLLGLSKVVPNEAILQSDLAQHWEVLAEAVQMVMRRYGCAQAYEQLKTLTRGKAIDQMALHQFIQSVNLPQEVKEQLLKLQPQDYLGYAVKLAEEI